MASKNFFLVGDDVSTAQSILVPPTYGPDELKRAVARHFHIVQPSGVSFHTSYGSINTVSDVLDANEPIGIRIDNQAVREPDGPEGLPIVGSFYEIFPDHLGNHTRLFRQYGGLIKTTNMGKTNYLTDDPEIAAVALNESIYFSKKINVDHPLWGVKDNIATFVGDTETETWRLSHKFLPTSMGPKAVRHYAPLIQETVRRSFAVFDAFAESGRSWNAYQYMVKLASETIGKVILGQNFGQLVNADAPFHPIPLSILTMFQLNKRVASRGAWYQNLPFGDPKKLRETHKLCYALIEGYVSDIETSDTAMPKMPMAEAALKASNLVEYLIKGTDEKGETFPRSMIVPNIVMLTSAGFTTTASLLSWLIYSVTEHPGNQERLLQELANNGISETTEWSVDLVSKLSFLDKFVKETQRLHNPAFQPARTAKTDVIVPGGYRLKADSVVVCALHSLHTNPNHWHDPSQFDPDRWDTAEVKGRHRAMYLPFATGPRGCIGFNFALLEAKIIFSELIYRYEFIRDGSENVQYDPEFQLVRPLNLYVSVRRRTNLSTK